MLNLSKEELIYLGQLTMAAKGELATSITAKINDELTRIESMVGKDMVKVALVFKMSEQMLAIKFYRALTGVGLKDAHDFIRACFDRDEVPVATILRSELEHAQKLAEQFPAITLLVSGYSS
jgi:ribosomal protein L7/L12